MDRLRGPRKRLRRPDVPKCMTGEQAEVEAAEELAELTEEEERDLQNEMHRMQPVEA